MQIILENCEQKEITDNEATDLVSRQIIYDSGEGYYHLEDGKTWKDVE